MGLGLGLGLGLGWEVYSKVILKLLNHQKGNNILASLMPGTDDWNKDALHGPRFGLDGGVPLEPQNPYPFVRIILAEKGTIFRIFSQNIGPFFAIFGKN